MSSWHHNTYMVQQCRRCKKKLFDNLRDSSFPFFGLPSPFLLCFLRGVPGQLRQIYFTFLPEHMCARIRRILLCLHAAPLDRHQSSPAAQGQGSIFSAIAMQRRRRRTRIANSIPIFYRRQSSYQPPILPPSRRRRRGLPRRKKLD